jgi:hypothetical protein
MTFSWTVSGRVTCQPTSRFASSSFHRRSPVRTSTGGSPITANRWPASAIEASTRWMWNGTSARRCSAGHREATHRQVLIVSGATPMSSANILNASVTPSPETS